MGYEYTRVRDLREDSDLSQAKIAAYLKEHTTTYQRWERGETEIPCHVLLILAKYYRVSTDYLLGLTDDPKGSWLK